MHAIPAPAAHPVRLPFYRQLYFQVVFAIVLGVLLGHFEPAYGEALKPLGDAFIKLVKMIIAPVIFLTIVTGISGMSQLSSVGRVFGKAMAYFLFFSTLALVVGLVVANVVQPGAGMNINVADLDQTAVKGYVAKSHEMTLTGFALDIIPKTLVSPFVGDNILQVLLVAVLFGIGLAMVGEAGRPVLNFLDALTTPVFKSILLVDTTGVHTGHMGNRLYRRHRLQPRAERVVEGLQGFLLQVDISQVVVHEGDEPDAVIDLLDAEALSGEHGGDVDLLSVHADASAAGYDDVLVVERIGEFGQAPIGAG